MEDKDNFKPCCSMMNIEDPNSYLSVLRDLYSFAEFEDQYCEYFEFEDMDLGDICMCQKCYNCSLKETCEKCEGNNYLIRMRWREVLDY